MTGQLGGSAPQTGAQAVVADAVDPARRPDVLLRVRREEGHEISAWWMIGAFVGVSGLVIGLLSFVPGGS
ncbi:UDP-N-acetylmuramyl pentapeptide phosphotransferase [Microbacterium sp. NPDC057407]|uniref:UDP-N-acetylmuramyl pentapeptide phosphotransferase n=1 Tax=Microbacterium sp. NPDC057407 TaxID=3346120 RepID=UPI0036704035